MAFTYNDKIYLNRSRNEYIYLIERSVLMLCAKADDNLRDELGITPFTFSELMKFIKLNLKRNVNTIILDESEIKK